MLCAKSLIKGLCLALWTCAVAQAQVAQDWASIQQGTSGAMVALDAGNNAYVAGSVPASTMLLTKYSPTGVQLWQRTFDNPGTREQSTWVTVDKAGNIIVTGTLVSTSFDPQGMVVLKYDAAGNLLWQDVIPLTFGYARRAEADAAGNVYVIGGGGVTFDIVTMKYSPSGVREWTRSYSDTGAAAPSSLDSAASMAITPAGQVIVTGGAQATMTAVAYDPAGNQIWSKSITPATAAMDVAVGPQGEFYLVGGDLSLLTPKGFMVVKHDANFNELWRRTYADGYFAQRAAVDGLGNLVAVGRTPGSYPNWMTIKIDPNGGQQWSRALDKMPSADEYANALVIGPDNAIYVTGQAGWLSSAFGNITTYLGATTVKYAADGTLLWSTQTQIPAFGLGIKLGTDGGVFVVADGPQALLHYAQGGSTALPVARITADRTVGPEPLTVNFSSAASTGAAGAIVGYRWNFGDGTGSLEANPTRVFAAGTFATTLTITDNTGATATSAPISITANPSAPLPPGPVSVNFSRVSVKAGKSVQATVYLAFPVPGPTALSVQLASSDPRVATVPASVTVPVGANSAVFTVRAQKVRRTATVAITATVNTEQATGVLTVVKD